MYSDSAPLNFSSIQSTDCSSLAPVKTVSSKNVPVVTYDYYDEDEEPFAIFKFFYRSQGKLPYHA